VTRGTNPQNACFSCGHTGHSYKNCLDNPALKAPGCFHCKSKFHKIGSCPYKNQSN
jgi:hypothetical protein